MTIARIATHTLAAAMLASVAAPAMAAGLDRAPQSLGILFEKGRVVELSFGAVNPEVSGKDLLGRPTGDVAKGYGFAGLAYKMDFNDNLSGAILVEQPYGSDVRYDTAAQGGSVLLGGTEAVVNGAGVTGVLRYKMPNGFGVHGGLRMSIADATVGLGGLAYGPLSGYRTTLDTSTGIGWLAGVSWEKPEIAARVSLTYTSPIKHEFDTRETFAGPLAAYNGTSTTDVTIPRSWNLEFQTGVAPDTLVFGGVRWTKWSEFKVAPKGFASLPGLSEGLVSLDDSTTYTIGVGRKFTENWSGSASFTYEAASDNDLVSPLTPTNGRKGITLAAIYTQDAMKVTAGVNYSVLGDARPETGTPDTARAQMTDSKALGFGLKVAYSF